MISWVLILGGINTRLKSRYIENNDTFFLQNLDFSTWNTRDITPGAVAATITADQQIKFYRFAPETDQQWNQVTWNVALAAQKARTHVTHRL